MAWYSALFISLATSGCALQLPWNNGKSPAQVPVLNTPVDTYSSPPTSVLFADVAYPTVDLGYTKHRAVYNPNPSLYKFHNIRYARPPVGDLRFKAPQPPQDGPKGKVENGKGRKECLQAMIAWKENFPEKDSCEDGACECCEKDDENGDCKTTCSRKQRDQSEDRPKSFLGAFLPNLTDPRLYSEDCLYLDVWAPKAIFNNRHNNQLKPVFVWIYGGAYIFGGKSLYFPGGLLDRSLIEDRGGMIFVSMNYRMGALGFAAGDDIPDEDTNAGLLDQQEALRWVQKHIAKFGGDPEQVTIAGLSAGGGSVIHHLTAYKGETEEKLFSKAISLSGGWQPVVNRTSATEIFRNFTKLAGAKDMTELRKVSEDTIRKVNYDQIHKAPPGSFLYNPTAWGDFAPTSPSKLLKSQHYRSDVEILLSHVYDEGGQFTGAFKNKSSTLNEFLNLALPDLKGKEREWVVENYGNGDEPDHVKIGKVIGDAIFRCPLTYVTHGYGQKVWRQRWNTVKSNNHGGDLLYLFYQAPWLLPSRLSALILQDYVATFAISGSPVTSVENPRPWANPVDYWRFDESEEGAVQLFDSVRLVRFPSITRGTTEPDEELCKTWQTLSVT